MQIIYVKLLHIVMFAHLVSRRHTAEHSISYVILIDVTVF